MLSRKRLTLAISLICATTAAAQTSAPISTTQPAVSTQQQWWEMQRQPAGPQTVVRVHDPCAIYADGAYYLFCTGRGIPMFRSDDLYHWTRVAAVFDTHPAWAAQEVPGSRGQWAPDISFFDGNYHLYYSISTFGSRRSCIGLTINKTLDPNKPDYKWVDQGKVVETHNSDNYNAIDPNLIMDESGHPWLVFGSCWDGIRITRLDRTTGKPPADEPAPRRLVHRPTGKLLEGPFVMRHDGWYYLFISFDACCRGANSTYNVVVGRSKQVDGPYADMDGVPMLEGGGTLVLAGYGNVRGPGHNGALTDAAGREWMVHHYYDAADRGISKLQVRRIVWATDGWPTVGEPVDKPITTPKSDQAPTPAPVPTGAWRYSFNFGDERAIQLAVDGAVEGNGSTGHWRASDNHLDLTWAANGPTHAAADRCTLADDGQWFVGRNAEGLVVRGRRAAGPSKAN